MSLEKAEGKGLFTELKKLKVFVTGTDTGIGKTLISAMLAKVWGAHYWKPIQAGTDPSTDSITVADWIGKEKVLPERYVLEAPRSPNQAAEREKLNIKLSDFELPRVDTALVVEGAGGLLVPINDQVMIIDLIKHLGIPAILVARSGLGTLNHTLLSIEALRAREIPILGVVLNGDAHEENARDIRLFGRVPIIGRMPWGVTWDESQLDRVYQDFHFQRWTV